jgi:hypothetical protein
MCFRIQVQLTGDSSLLRLTADSFGMTASIGVVLLGSNGDSLIESPLLPNMPHKIVSFRALARNLIINLFEIAINNRYSYNQI